MKNRGKIVRWCAIGLIFTPCVKVILQRGLGVNEK